MRFLRSSENPNTIVGLFLLIILAVIAGPGFLPSLLPSVIPFADEAIPCGWLRTGEERAEHQSLIGRNAAAPIRLRVRTTPLPAASGQSLRVTVIVTNTSLGTIAIFYNPNQVLIGDDNATSGLGIAFNRPNPTVQGGGGTGPVPEDDIRLLGPRQSCVHRQEWGFEQIPQLGLTAAINSVKAYYRNTSPGTSQAVPGSNRIIFTDQGLWVGVVESESVQIPFAGS